MLYMMQLFEFLKNGIHFVNTHDFAMVTNDYINDVQFLSREFPTRNSYEIHRLIKRGKEIVITSALSVLQCLSHV